MQDALFKSIVAVVVLFTALSAGYLTGRQEAREPAEATGYEKAKAEDSEERTVEARILEWVVARNPNATIKDFADFPATVIAESKAAGLDFRLVLAIIDKESEFNPRAVGRAGEIGLMQLMPPTAAAIAKNLGWDYTPPTKKADGTYASLGTLSDPKANVRFGVAYLKDQVAKFGPTPAALRAYNRGPGAALQHRPHDRYAEDVAFRFMAFEVGK